MEEPNGHGNSDMRVVIAGAGGRMGRTLIQAIAATKGLALAGAVDAPGSAVIGRDAGELAGLGAERHQGDERCRAACLKPPTA